MGDLIAGLEAFILDAAAQWWVLPLTGLLCLVDGFFPVVPSESVVVALAAIADQGLAWSLWALWAVAAAGAFLGDQVAYLLGRAVGTERFGWMRRGKVQEAFGLARRQLEGHGALLIFCGRFIPGGRVAVNFTAGALRFRWAAFAGLDLMASAAWAGLSILIARVTAGWLDNALIQMAVAIVAASLAGVLVDRLMHLLLRRRGADRPEQDGSGEPEGSAVDSRA